MSATTPPPPSVDAAGAAGASGPPAASPPPPLLTPQPPPPRRRPGRPPKASEVKVPYTGPAAAPSRPGGRLELCFHTPQVFQAVARVIKQLKVTEAELWLRADPGGLTLCAAVPIGDASLVARLPAALMNHYYCAPEGVEGRVECQPFEGFLSNIAAAHHKISLSLAAPAGGGPPAELVLLLSDLKIEDVLSGRIGFTPGPLPPTLRAAERRAAPAALAGLPLEFHVPPANLKRTAKCFGSAPALLRFEKTAEGPLTLRPDTVGGCQLVVEYRDPARIRLRAPDDGGFFFVQTAFGPISLAFNCNFGKSATGVYLSQKYVATRFQYEVVVCPAAAAAHAAAEGPGAAPAVYLTILVDTHA